MATVSFDGSDKEIVISDTGNVTISAKEIYSRWKEWMLENPQWEPAFRTFGGDPLGGGLVAGDYYFLNNVAGWRIKPQEKDHILTINGNLFGDDADTPIFSSTQGRFIVTIRQGYSSLTQTTQSSGSSGGLTTQQALQLAELYRINGLELNSPLIVNKNKRMAGNISQTIGGASDTITVIRDNPNQNPND